MDRAGFQIQTGSLCGAAPPCLSSCAAVVKTQLPLLPRGDCSLRRPLSWGNLQLGVFHPRLSKGRVLSSGRGFPKANRGELSTAEAVGEKLFDEAIRGGEGAGGAKVLEHSERYPGLSAEEEGSSFDWLAQWYPVGVLKHLDKRQPHAVTTLGRDLVMWWDQSGAQWQVFADVCPHRLAPLSEGRINEQGHLQCSYHGWSFAPSSGACTLIPQAPKQVFERKDSKRSCAKVYVSTEQQGLLWVYMDTSEGAKETSAANPPPHIPVLSDPDFFYDMGSSDLSYSYESLIENLLDPAHVPFAHHGLQGKRSLGKPLDFRVDKIEKGGFVGFRAGQLAHTFIAPCLSAMEFKLSPPSPPKGHPWALKLREFIMSKIVGGDGSNRQLSTVFFCVPVAPGMSRVFFAFPRNFGKLAFDLTPRWWAHLVHMTVLDSDMYLLHLMERRLEDRGGMAHIEKLYYTPTTSDGFVVSYRKWLKKFGGSVPDYGPKASAQMPPSATKRELLDRYSLHVAHCTICSGTLRNFKLIQSVLHNLPLVLVGLVAASNVKPLRGFSNFTIPLLCAALVCSLASQCLKSWIKKNYKFHDYNHALVK